MTSTTPNTIQNVRIFTSPEKVDREELEQYQLRVFLAGGISNCPDWQQDIIDLIVNCHDWRPKQLLLINPRLANFDPTAGPEVIQNQVKWEFDCLNHIANLHLFWFPKETMCPITLYELGRSVSSDISVLVGTHPEYQRLTTMKQQLQLIDSPSVSDEMCHSLQELVQQLLRKVQ